MGEEELKEGVRATGDNHTPHEELHVLYLRFESSERVLLFEPPTNFITRTTLNHVAFLCIFEFEGERGGMRGYKHISTEKPGLSPSQYESSRGSSGCLPNRFSRFSTTSLLTSLRMFEHHMMMRQGSHDYRAREEGDIETVLYLSMILFASTAKAFDSLSSSAVIGVSS
jgi:hypothetical protein